VDAQYTKLVGAGLLFACVSSLLALSFGSVDVAGKPFRAGGYMGEWLALWMSEYLNRIGSIVVILTLLFLAIVLLTQLSLGRVFSSATRVSRAGGSRMFGALRSWLDERRRARQRQALIEKQAKKDKPSPLPPAPAPVPAPPVAIAKKPAETVPIRPAPVTVAIPDEVAALEERRPPVMAKRQKLLEAPPLPLPDPEPRPARRIGAFTIPPLSLLDAPKTERKIDERELMEGARLLEEKCREFAVEGAVAQIHPGPVVTTFEFKPDAGTERSPAWPMTSAWRCRPSRC
jgi:S-DNA-T family DNA segregation ATPase FtsK/SpoIIIE